MINLSTESGYVRLKSWDDLQSVPGYVDDVHIDTALLKQVIGNYVFDQPGLCGLAVCRQPHGRGYLVELADGRKINIGKDCGKKYLGTDFDLARKRFERERWDQENRETLSAFQNRLPHLRRRIDELREGAQGANWLHRTMRDLLGPGRGVPNRIVSEIAKIVRNRDPRVMRDRRATKQEMEQYEVAGGVEHDPKRLYVPELVGVLDGLPALYRENDLRTLLVTGVASDLSQIEGKVVTSLSSHELRSLSKIVSEVDGKIAQAERAIEEGRKLLRRKNLSIFGVYLADAADRQQFSTYLKALPE